MSGRWRAGIALALFVAATVLVTWRAHRLAQSLEEREKSKTSALRGQPAPEFSLPVLTPAGQSAPAAAELALADYRGQIVLISFWASWCRPCDYELPLLNQFYLARRAHEHGQGKFRRGLADERGAGTLDLFPERMLELVRAVGQPGGSEKEGDERRPPAKVLWRGPALPPPRPEALHCCVPKPQERFKHNRRAKESGRRDARSR